MALVLYGGILMEGLAALLARTDGVAVARVSSCEPDLTDRLVQLAPAAIIFDAKDDALASTGELWLSLSDGIGATFFAVTEDPHRVLSLHQGCIENPNGPDLVKLIQSLRPLPTMPPQ